MDALWLLLQSRKFLVGTLAVLSSFFIAMFGIYKGLPDNSILAIIAAVTAVAWKLIDAIASEDNSKRDNMAFMLEVAHDIADKSPEPQNTPANKTN